MTNSTVCQSKWKPIVEPRRVKPKTYGQALTHWLKFYKEAVRVRLGDLIKQSVLSNHFNQRWAQHFRFVRFSIDLFVCNFRSAYLLAAYLDNKTTFNFISNLICWKAKPYFVSQTFTCFKNSNLIRARANVRGKFSYQCVLRRTFS